LGIIDLLNIFSPSFAANAKASEEIGWWKRHLKVYHLIARSEHGLMVQILAGLITYLLLAIYCHEQHDEKVSIARVRELRFNIRNELVAAMAEGHPPAANRSDPHVCHSYAIP